MIACHAVFFQLSLCFDKCVDKVFSLSAEKEKKISAQTKMQFVHAN
jgi:hypothetical protein